MPLKSFKAIAAMSLNRVIGSGGKIPWYVPEDFKWFKAVTMGHVLVMGRRTFESIGKALPGRETLILSRSGFSAPGARSIGDLSEIQTDDPRTFFICGGAQIYQQYLSVCTELFLTTVKQVVAGDAFFPPFEHQFDRIQEIADAPGYNIVRYLRR